MDKKFVCRDCGKELPSAATPHNWDDCVDFIITDRAALRKKLSEAETRITRLEDAIHYAVDNIDIYHAQTIYSSVNRLREAIIEAQP